MKLFFKHLLKSIARRPLQPLIIVLTLALSILVTNTALTLKKTLFEEERLAISEENGSADITVSQSSSSKSRFMFTSGVKEILGGDCSAAGYYEVVSTLSGGNKAIFAAAADFSEIGEIFTLKFSEYSGVSTDTVSDSAFISRSFADENGLSLNDEFTLSIFGSEKTYKVVGISEKPFIKSYNVLLDIKGVTKLLAKDSVFASAIGEDFKPSSKILIKLQNNLTAEEAIDKLLSDEAFQDKTIRPVNTPSNENVSAIGSAISAAITLSCLLSAAVSFSSLFILSKERSEENYSFIAAGAKPILMHFMQYAEVFLYWIAASAVSFALLLPLNVLFNVHLKFKFTKLVLIPLTFLLSSLAILAVALITSFIFVFSEKRKHSHKASANLSIGIFAVCLLLSVMLFVCSGRVRMAIGVSVLALAVFLLFIESKRIVRFAAKRTSDTKKIFFSDKKHRSSLYYAFKNTYAVSALHNIARLIAVSVAITLTVYTLITAGTGSIVVSENIFSEDYVVVGATSRSKEKLLACEANESVSSVYISVGHHESGLYTNMIAADDISVFSDMINVTVAPKDNGAVISLSDSKMMKLSKGDTFTVDGNEFYVLDIIPSGIPLVIFDAEYYGVGYNCYIPRKAENVSASQSISQITAALSDEVASLIKTKDVLEARMSIYAIYIRCGTLLLPFLIIFALIGIFNTASEGYRSRREEFSLYNTAGMTRREIRKTKLFEMLIAVSFGLSFGVLLFLALLPIINETMLSIGMDTYNNVKHYFASI